jgi:hypothetical protein
MSTPESSAYMKAAVIGGIFAVIAACVGGVFLILNTLVNNGFIVIGPSVQTGNPSQPATAAVVVTYTSPNFDICQDISKYPGNFSSMPGIPTGNSMTITVQNGEIHAMTAGSISVAGINLPGGRDRGGVVILLPSATYNITELNPTYNWHGVFRLEPDEWASLANVLAAQQMIPGTCIVPEGCAFVDVLVVGPNGVITQYEKRGPSAVNCLP